MIYLESAPHELKRMHCDSVPTSEEANTKFIAESMNYFHELAVHKPDEWQSIPKPTPLENIIVVSAERKKLIGKLISDNRMEAFWKAVNNNINNKQGKCFPRLLFFCVFLEEVEDALKPPDKLGNMTRNERCKEYLDISAQFRMLANKLTEFDLNVSVSALPPMTWLTMNEIEAVQKMIRNNEPIKTNPVVSIVEIMESMALLAESRGQKKDILDEHNKEGSEAFFFTLKMKSFFDYWLHGFMQTKIVILAEVCLDNSEPLDSETIRKRRSRREKSSSKK